jgi:hypothetical protein
MTRIQAASLLLRQSSRGQLREWNASLRRKMTILRMTLAAFLTVAMSLTSLSTIEAHQDSRVGLCIPYYSGGPCARGNLTPSYYYDESIPIKGRVSPVHSGIIKIQRTKGTRPWRTVAKARINGKGRYRWVWQPEPRHADQGRPHRFRAILPNHDVSPVRKVAVLYRE